MDFLLEHSYHHNAVVSPDLSVDLTVSLLVCLTQVKK